MIKNIANKKANNLILIILNHIRKAKNHKIHLIICLTKFKINKFINNYNNNN
jgi:hypothetical protein